MNGFFRRRCSRQLWLKAGLGGSLAIGAFGTGCSGAHEPVQHSPANTGHPVTKAIANVPALLNAPIDTLRQRLGSSQNLPPAYEEAGAYTQLGPRITDSVAMFNKNGLLVVACYDVRSRRVHDLLLLGNREDSLMRQATLRSNAANYLVLPVFHSKRPGALLGLRVVTTKQN